MKPVASATRCLTDAEKQSREAAWDTLMCNGAPLSWAPPLIDVALAYNSSPADFGEICTFVIERGASSLSFADLFRPNGRLLLTWIRKEARRRVPAPALRDDAASILLQLTHDACRSFCPIVPVHRHWNSSGFEAYVRLYSRGLPRLLARTHTPCGDHSLDAADTLTGRTLHDSVSGSAARRDPELASALVDSLRRAIASPLAWDCVYRMTYCDAGLRELAARHGIPRSSLSRQIAAPIVESLRRLLETCEGSQSVAPADLGTITKALARFLAREEFVELIPPPAEIMGHAARADQLRVHERSSHNLARTGNATSSRTACFAAGM